MAVPRRSYAVLLFALAACGGDDGGTEPPPTTAVKCDTPATLSLAVGAHQIANPASSGGCVRLPGANSESEYLVALVSGAGQVTTSGVSGPFALRANTAGSMAGTAQPTGASAMVAADPQTRSWPQQFHQALRESEQRLAADPTNRLPVSLSPAAAAAPAVGSERLFRVCKNLSCTQFDSVTAVARSVTEKVAVYLDKVVPTTDSLRQEDLDELARTFTTYHHPINADAFGGESDRDNNQVVIILMTDAVNALTPDCTNGRILGFFWGGDLLSVTGSNSSEIFYTMVPAPATSTCTSASRKQVVDRIKPTLIHEFQHMISFNQHVLVRSGPSEATWLNEALSHLAEELAGKLIPNSECAGFTSCRSQYASGNIFNGWDFLEDTEATFLVVSGSSNGTLEERGAGWLFVRWLVDQFGTDSLGSNVTRGLVQTSQTGAQAVSTVAGTEFPILVGEWMLATYVDDLAGFSPVSPRLTYTTWGLRKVFQDNCCTPGAAFPRAFPTTPVSITSSGFPFLRSGTLRGGSGRHFSVTVGAGSQGVDLLLSRESNGPAIDPALTARLAVVRVR
jgi:hypothetical protein